jgi:hypothetical protein
MLEKLKWFFVLFSLLLVPAVVLANGGPLDVSENYGSGNVTLMRQHDIILEEENLWVEIDGDYANVAVEYKLKNQGPEAKISYGFPLDLMVREFDGTDKPPQAQDTNFKIKDDSGDLEVTTRLEADSDGLGKNDSEGDREFKIVRQWYITEIAFQAQELKTLKVSYRLKNRFDDWIYSKSFEPVFSDRIFQYILQPSKNWGNGLVKHFSAVIDLKKLLEFGGTVKEVKPQGYQFANGILKWRHENFDLNKAQDIQVAYDNSASKMSKYVSEYRAPKNLILKTSASSVLPTDSVNKYHYGPDNLFDNDYSTAWVEGVKGPGRDQWVEVDLDKVSISGIGIINGYTKKKSLYYANNRIKKLRLDVEWDNWGDRDGGQDTREITLKQKQFNELNQNAEAPFISWLADYGDGYNRAKKIRLTILEVYPGTKYDDTPITELFILGQQFEDQAED